MLALLDYLRRSGRVNFLRAGLGDALQLKLLVELADGEVIERGRIRTRRRGLECLVHFVQHIGPLAHRRANGKQITEPSMPSHANRAMPPDKYLCSSVSICGCSR